MKIARKYSHLNGEEFLIVHRNTLYDEIKSVISAIQADEFKTKVSSEKTTRGKKFYSPVELNREFKKRFNSFNWQESRYQYYITLDRELMEKSLNLSAKQQRKFLEEHGEKNPIFSYNQTDFVKNKVAVEVQFGKYAFVAYDIFVKHMLFYSGGLIDLGVEILPTKAMQTQMSSGVAYFEGEVYHVLRHGRNNPAIPLLILGIEPD